MPTKTLTIEFGGLCMFVRQDTNAAHSLYVLMPTVSMSLNPHCPMLVVPQSGSGKKADLYSLDGWSIDLSPLRRYNSDNTPTNDDFKWALKVSDYTNKRVQSDWFVEIKDPIAARIRLPLNVKVNHGDTVPITVVGAGSGNPPGDITANVAGRASVDITLENWDDDVIQVGPAIIDMTAATTTVYVVNIQVCDLPRRKPHSHSKGDIIDHPMAYYTLLEGRPKGNKLKVGQDVSGDVDDSICIPEPCPGRHHVIRFDPPGPLHNRWIDTHDCAIGTGDYPK